MRIPTNLFALLVFGVLLAGCNSPTLVGTQAYKERIQNIEREIESHLAKGETLIVFRTTAPKMKIRWQVESGEKSDVVYGPVVALFIEGYSGRPVSGAYSLIGEYATVDQQHDYHKHSIEVYQGGRKIAERTKEGPNEWFGVSLFLR